MKERLITLACALGALALFLTLFVRSAGLSPAGTVPRPTTEDRGGAGYYAAMRWLKGEGIRSISLRQRFDSGLVEPHLAARGNLLIVTLPGVVSYRRSELRALERWVRRGNTLLVLAALADEPDWAVDTAARPAADLGSLTGLTLEPLERARTGVAFAPPQLRTLVPNRPDVYFEGVGQAVALSDHPAQRWRMKVPRDGFVLTLASSKETGEGVLWTRSVGAGRVLVSGFGSLFAARTLGLAGNARLLANIVSSTVAPEGAVLFDDLHQGVGEADDPARFYKDPRLYRTLGWIAAVWLAWVLGSTRLRAAPARAPAPSEADLVRSTGGFLARVVPPPEAARGLLEHFLRRMGAASASAQQVWERLEHDPRIAREDAVQLHRSYLAACAGRHVPLARLHNLILRIEKRLSQ